MYRVDLLFRNTIATSRPVGRKPVEVNQHSRRRFTAEMADQARYL